MSNRKSILVLTPRLPYPVIGGDRLRIHRLCRELARRYDLTLLALCEHEREMTLAIPDDGVFGSVERVLLPRWRSWLNCLMAAPTGTPLQVAYYRSAVLTRRVQALAARHDAVLAHLVRTAEYVRQLPGPRFLEMTDAISLNYHRVRTVGARTRKLQSLVYAVEERRLRAYERAVAEDFDATVLVSTIDRDHLFDAGLGAPRNVLVCSNGVDAGEMPFRFHPGGRDVVFIGNMTSVQNLDAASYFATDVLPVIRARSPDVRFRAVGRIRPKDRARLARVAGVDVTGEVASIPEAVRGGGVAVCPLRLGAGVQNKVLEYMALGLPTVTTSVGLEGFEATPGRDLIVADGAEEIAAAVGRLLADRTRAQAIATAARRYVEEAHSWKARVAPLLDVIDAALEREHARREPRAVRASTTNA